MAKNCVTEKTVQRQRWIEDGLLTLMKQNNYSPVTVSDLCRHLQLSRRSFYRYFQDLDDVIDSLIERTFQNLAVAPMRPSEEDLQHSFDFWLDRRNVLETLICGGYVEKLYQFTLKYTDFHIFNGDEADDSMEKETKLFVIGGFLSLVFAWQKDGFQKSSKEMAKVAYRMLYKPFFQ